MNEPVIPEKRKEGLRVSVKELAFVLAVLLLGLFLATKLDTSMAKERVY